jgi:HPt (histidine-containing phosphotransfer) domain-containing protein
MRPLVDQAVMCEIAALDDGALIKQLLSLHARDAVVALRAIEQNLEVRHWAHKLKGSSSTLGLTALADACSALEEACDARRDTASAARAVLETYEATLVALKAL